MRRYDRWAGNPKGTPEDPKRCIAEVATSDHWHFLQCARDRGHGQDGLFCAQHARRLAQSKPVSVPRDEVQA